MKVIRGLLLGFLLTLLPGPALAHTELVSAEPSPGATVDGPVTSLILTFTEPLSAGSDVQVFAGAFQAVADISTSVSANVLSAHLADPLAPGTYTVQWVALGADGHPVAGSYQFAVAAPVPPRWMWVLPAIVTVVAVVAVTASLLMRRRLRRIDCML